MWRVCVCRYNNVHTPRHSIGVICVSGLATLGTYIQAIYAEAVVPKIKSKCGMCVLRVRELAECWRELWLEIGKY